MFEWESSTNIKRFFFRLYKAAKNHLSTRLGPLTDPNDRFPYLLIYLKTEKKVPVSGGASPCWPLKGLPPPGT